MPSTHQAAERVRIAVAITAWCGVLFELWLSLKLARDTGKPASAGWITYSGYFTIITNIFVGLVFMLPSHGLKSRVIAWLGRPSVRGCAVTSSLLVAISYHFLLREYWSPQGAQWLAYTILHYVVPAGALLHWVLERPRADLAWTLPPRWCSYPFIYLGYAMMRGEIIRIYPYPFIDVGVIGYPQAILNALVLILAFLLLGFFVVWISRQPGRRQPTTDSIAE